MQRKKVLATNSLWCFFVCFFSSLFNPISSRIQRKQLHWKNVSVECQIQLIKDSALTLYQLIKHQQCTLFKLFLTKIVNCGWKQWMDKILFMFQVLLLHHMIFRVNLKNVHLMISVLFLYVNVSTSLKIVASKIKDCIELLVSHHVSISSFRVPSINISLQLVTPPPAIETSALKIGKFERSPVHWNSSFVTFLSLSWLFDYIKLSFMQQVSFISSRILCLPVALTHRKLFSSLSLSFL